MTKRYMGTAALAVSVALCWVGTPAHAKDDAEPKLATCQQSLGTVAIVDGDTQGWTKFGLGSPRDLIAAMAAQSGCFTLHNASSGKPADFLMNAIAGDKEEVDQGMSLARSALTTAAVHSGAMGAVASRVPMVGGMLGGMMGGFGGKKKTVAAALRVMSPATGQTIASGSGETKKSSISIGGLGGYGGNPWGDAARAQMSAMGYGDYANGAYASSKDGKMLTTAFIQAFNSVVSQSSALSSARGGAPAVAAAASSGYTTAIDTQMYAAAAKGASVRALRAGTSLTPTGNRSGLFVEVKDSFGTQGWVSVEDLK